MSIFNTVEFYVIAGTLAAAVAAAASLPARRRAVVLHTAEGELSFQGDPAQPSPAIDVEVDDNRRVIIRRSGLPAAMRSGGAVNLAVNVSGFDVEIEERITYGRLGEPVDTATFSLDFFAPERYHVKYNSEDLGIFTAFSLPVREGIRVRRELK